MNTSKLNHPKIHGNRKELAAIIRWYYWQIVCSWHSDGFGNRFIALFILHYNAAPLVSGQLPTCVGVLVAIVEAIGLCFQQALPPG